MRFFAGATILAALSCSPAAAQTAVSESIATGLRTCASVVNDSQRLTCFDVLMKSFPTSPAAAGSSSVQDVGKWVVRSTTSAIDDSKNVFVSITGERGITNQYGRDAEITLVVACRENKTSAYVIFGGHFMSSIQGQGRVTYRIDQQPAQTKSFEASNDHEALGLWSGGNSIPWIKSLFGGKRMYIEATPYSESAISDYMPIANLEEAIKPLRESCKW